MESETPQDKPTAPSDPTPESSSGSPDLGPGSIEAPVEVSAETVAVPSAENSTAGASSVSPQKPKQASKPLPVWARALITVVSASMILSLAAVVGMCIFFKNTFEHAQDPQFISQLAQKVAQFPQPLPKGYSYIFGVDFFNLIKIVSIDYENGKQQFSFYSYVNNRKDPEVGQIPMSVDGLPVTPPGQGIGDEVKFETEAQKTLNRIYNESGVNTFTVQARFQSLISKGSWLIQGVQIPYMVGKLTGNNGTGLVACIVDTQNNKDIVIYAVQPDDKDFDMKVCTNLLQDIKGF